MNTARVYQYELFDPVSRGFVRQRGLATEVAVAGMRGIVMHSTGRDVPASEISALGVWEPKELFRALSV